MGEEAADRQESLVELLRARPFGLSLCAKFFGFFAHAGFVAALEEQGLKPAAVGGTSAGALVGALWAAGLPARRIVEILAGARREDFWDPVSPLELFSGRAPAAGLLEGRKLEALLRRHLPATFEELELPFFVEALNLTRGRLEVLSSGDLPAAVLASCAYPGLFRPARIGEEHYWDGGFVNKAPIGCLAGHAELILVHYMGSSVLEGRPTGVSLIARSLRALARGLAVARREVAVSQALLAAARGVPVHLLRTSPAASGPTKMRLGARIMREAKAETSRLLEAPAADSRLADSPWTVGATSRNPKARCGR